MFSILQQVLAAKEWVPIRRADYPKPETVTALLNDLCAHGLIECEDPTSWAAWQGKGRARRYRALTPLQSTAILDSPRFKSYDDYVRGKPARRSRRVPPSTVSKDADAPFDLSEAVKLALVGGTGITADPLRAPGVAESLVADKKPPKQSELIRLIEPCTNAGELRPQWTVRKCGRLCSSSPNVQGLPKEFIPGLRSIAPGFALYEVDYVNNEPQIAAAKLELPPSDDIYIDVAELSGLDRDAAKGAVPAIFHGQTENNIRFNPKLTPHERAKALIQHRAAVDALAVLGYSPAARKELKSILKPTAAAQLFAALDAVHVELVLSGGIPKHDGWIFAAPDEATAERVRTIFADVAGGLHGRKVPVRLTRLTPDSAADLKRA